MAVVVEVGLTDWLWPAILPLVLCLLSKKAKKEKYEKEKKIEMKMNKV